MTPKLYLILGTQNSGRREILIDLISNNPFPPKKTYILTHEEDSRPSDEIQTQLKSLQNTEIIPYTYENGKVQVANLEDLDEDGSLFFVTHGSIDIIDQIESFNSWLKKNRFHLTRVFSVIDCQFAQKTPKLEEWFDCIIYFSDCVLLNKRQDVSNKFIDSLITKYEKMGYPCIFDLIKKGQTSNPALILESEARRTSHIFDDIDPIDQLELDEENLPDEPFILEVKPDRYMERNERNYRIIKLPSVKDFLD